MSKKLQLTLAILKPDLTLRPYCVDQVRDMLLQNDFIFVKSKEEHLDPVNVKSFYKEHQGKFFYNRLVTYMSRYERKIILYNLSIFITSVKHCIYFLFFSVVVLIYIFLVEMKMLFKNGEL